MNQIVVKNNKQCQLELSDNPEMGSRIRTLLSFKQEGAEYSAAFKHGGWNGMICLLGKNNTFPFGLLGKVRKLLDEAQICYSVIDKRVPIVLGKSLDISKKLKKLNMVPRDYQIEALDAALKHHRGMLKIATGGGKSLVLSMIAAKYNLPACIFVIGLDLLSQFHKTLSSIFDEKIGFIGNGIYDVQRINVVSVWSVGSALGCKDILDDDLSEKKETVSESNKSKIIQMLADSKLFLFDEAHICACDTIKSIYKNINPAILIGCSGTPKRDDGLDLVIEGMIGPQIIDIPASKLIAKGILAQPIIKFVDVPKSDVYGKSYAEVYSQYIVENDMRNMIVLNQTRNLIEKGYQTLVLFKQIKHGKILFDLFKKNGIDCAMLNGSNSLDERDEIKEDLLFKRTNVILASVIYDTGIDISTLSGLVLAGGGKSITRTNQRIGRVIRKCEGKKYAAVVDFFDNCRYLNKHSQKRYEIYKLEDGFIVKPSKGIK